MAKCNRESVAGGDLGIIISSAYIYLAQWARRMNRELIHNFGGDTQRIKNNRFELAGRTMDGITLINDCVDDSVAYLADYTLERAFQMNEIDLSIKGVHTVNGMVFFRSLSTEKLRKMRLVIIFTIGNSLPDTRKSMLIEDKMDCDDTELAEIVQGSTLR